MLPPMSARRAAAVVACWFGILVVVPVQRSFDSLSPVWFVFALVELLLVLGVIWSAHGAGRDVGFREGFRVGYQKGVIKMADEARTILSRTFGPKP